MDNSSKRTTDAFIQHSLSRRTFLETLVGLLTVHPDILAQELPLPLINESDQNRHKPFDFAEREENISPLLAGEFQKAIQVLPGQVKSHPGDPRFPYSLATVYLRLKQYSAGIPYARLACVDNPLDVRYRWMLRVLTLSAHQPESSIPLNCRLTIPPAAPSPVHFSDATRSAGIKDFSLGRGAAWGDYNRDGREDLLVCSERGPFHLFRNLGHGRFEDVAKQVGLVDPVGLGGYAANFIDYDNDGYEDIFITSNGWGGKNRLFLFHNDHGQRFVDVTNKAGLGGIIDAFGAAWADYDNDGNVDAVVATGIIQPGGDRLRLFHNDGKGTFKEVGEQAGLTKKARWISVCWCDYDGDGRPDLLAVSFESGCTLYHNMGSGKFEDVTDRSGLKCPGAHYTCNFLDYNNDGHPDIFVSAYPNGNINLMIAHHISGAPAQPDHRQLLFRNNGDGTFTRVTEQAGLQGWHAAMASQVGDVDNDGFPDIILGTGNPQIDWAEPKVLYHNDGKGHFVNIADSAGIVNYGMLHGIAFSDYDDSGNWSFYGSYGGFYWGTREDGHLYHNEGTQNHSLEIRLVGTRSNRDAIGARVTALVGTRHVYKWVQAGSGFCSMNSRIVHIGTGKMRTVTSLEIIWPSGLHQSFANVSTGQRIEITEGNSKVKRLVAFKTSVRNAQKTNPA